MRQHGFYWVKFVEDNEWTVAYYEGGNRPWLVVGCEVPFPEDRLSVVGQKIEMLL